MTKIQLTHPEGKKAPSIDKIKYDILKTTFLNCLKTKKSAPFKELLSDVEKDFKKSKLKVEGKLEWNLFWVTLDLESRKELDTDRNSSPIIYTIPK